ncbi:MAG TPA: ABC transporter permease [Clostridiales bacterium]|nr:ABC transporter permease [Clostridiales bacterium]
MVVKKIINKFYLPIILVLAIIFFAITTDAFFSVHNLTNIFVQNSYLVVATMGIAIVMIAGGADLSVSWQMGLVSVICGMLLQNNAIPVPLIIFIGILLGGSLGLFNGLITIKLKVHPMVATLATMTIFQGIAYVLCGGSTFFNFPDSFKAIGQKYLFGWLPMSVIIMFVMYAIAYVILKKMYFGRHIYSLGGNEEAARMAGLNTKFIRVASFVLSGVFIAIAAMVLTARTGTASPGIASDAVFICISACVLGGISFNGGEGNITNMFISVMLLGIISNGMQLMGLSIYSQYIMKGTILALAIAFDNYQKKSHQIELANQAKTAR